MTYALLLLLAALAAWAMFAFNRLVRLRNQVKTAWADIDVQLQRRHDLVPSLVAAVQARRRCRRHNRRGWARWRHRWNANSGD